MLYGDVSMSGLWQAFKAWRKEWKRTSGIDYRYKCPTCGGQMFWCEDAKCHDMGGYTKVCPYCTPSYNRLGLCPDCDKRWAEEGLG